MSIELLLMLTKIPKDEYWKVDIIYFELTYCGT